MRKLMNESPDRSCSKPAFTRLELVTVLAALALLTAIALPGLATSRPRSEQAACFNNLRQIGRAFQEWASDHGDRNPWVTPASEGGTYVGYGSPTPSWAPLRGNAWFQMGTISNELGTPKLLVCPSDWGVGASRRVATDFSYTNANGGFFAPGFRNNALSYTIGLHSFAGASRAILSGDRHIRWDVVNGSCSYGGPALICTINGGSLSVAWTNAIHRETGNLLLNDGRVEQLTSSGLQHSADISSHNVGGLGNHILAP